MGRSIIIWSILIFILFYLGCSPALGGEENDLWLLLSSYEDIGITVNDLAFFLATHGYNAAPESSYVVVKFTSGKEVYLTPNGAEPRLADLWMNPPTERAGPIMVLPPEAIKTDVKLNRTFNQQFVKTASKYVIFPVTPLGMCYDGSQQLYDIYMSFDYETVYLFDPSQYNSQGHLWVAVEDPSKRGSWLAVDSYYGIMMDDEYYVAPYSFTDFKYLDSINPKWRLV